MSCVFCWPNKRTAHTGAVTLIQRFGSALNLNIHFHMLFLDGVYAEDKYGVMRFHRVKAPTIGELNTLVHQISHRVTRFLEKKGCLQLPRFCPELPTIWHSRGSTFAWRW